MNLSFLFYISAVLSLVLVTSAKKVPDDVELLFPPDGTRITAGQIVPFGVVQDTKDQVLGVLRDVYFYLRYPNGTEEYIMRMWDTCDSGAPGIILHGNSTGTSFVLMEEPGTYVATWTIMYNQSADTSQANETYCGPQPFSTEQWNLTREFRVEPRSNSAPSATLTATSTVSYSNLPSKPTSHGGNVNAGFKISRGIEVIFVLLGVAITTSCLV